MWLLFPHSDKFREIYNFAFAWAREKVSLSWRIFVSEPLSLFAVGQHFLFINIILWSWCSLCLFSWNMLLILQGQKSLALETALGMWQLLFAERHWPLIDHWCQFLQVCLKGGSMYLHFQSILLFQKLSGFRWYFANLNPSNFRWGIIKPFLGTHGLNCWNLSRYHC